MSTEEQRAKWREEWARRYADPEYRKKRSNWARLKYQSDPAYREAIRQSVRRSRQRKAESA